MWLAFSAIRLDELTETVDRTMTKPYALPIFSGPREKESQKESS